MPRISTDFTPTPEAKKTLDGIGQKMGMVPNIFKLMAQAPNVLNGYVALSSAMSHGTLSAKEREHIALTVAGFDKCTYCAAAHSMLGQKAGISKEETQANLQGKSNDQKTTGLINFVLAILRTKGQVADADLKGFRAAGYNDQQIVETLAVTIENVFTNYFNNLADTEVDFPKVEV